MELNRILNRVVQIHQDFHLWGNGLILIRKWLATFELELPQMQEILDVLDKGHLLVGIILKKAEMQRRVETEVFNEKLRLLEEAMRVDQPLETMLTSVGSCLENLGLHHFHLVLCQQPGVHLWNFCLLYSRSGELVRPLAPGGVFYHTVSELIRDIRNFDNQVSYCVLPLAIGAEYYGFFFMEKLKSTHSRLLYENFANLFTSFYKNLRRSEEFRQAYCSLEELREELQQEPDTSCTGQNGAIHPRG